MKAVWAYSIGAPGKTCPDARLLGNGTNIQYPAGNDKGQAGWDVGLMFNKISDLAEKIRVLQTNKPDPIMRLAINLHGMPGKIDADSKGTEAGMYDFDQLWNRYSSPLTLINLMLSSGAAVLIMGCNVAKGDEGAAFISALSKTAFPDHNVVGFTTIGETLRQFRSGDSCTEPGMRDTNYDNPSQGMPFQNERESEVLTLPWASESSPHSKIALNGKIVVDKDLKVAPVDYFFQAYLPGTWMATIGSWSGYFVFHKDGTIFWSELDSSQRHNGKWWTMAGSVEWSFSDDNPGWKRNFQVLTPLKTALNGNIIIKGVNHGSFSMSKQF